MTCAETGDRRATLIAYGGLVVLTVVWGTQFLVIKSGQQYVPPLLGAATRFAVLAAVAQAAIAVSGARAPAGYRGGRLVFAVSQAAAMVLLHGGQNYLTSALAGILFCTAPLFVALLAGRYVDGERVDPATVAALAAGFGGVVLITGSSMPAEGWFDARLLGVVALLGAAFANATNKVFAKNLTEPVPAAVLLRDMGAVVAVVAAGGWWLFEREMAVEWTATAVVSHLYLGVVASAAASALFLVLLRRYRVTAMSYLQFVTAGVAVVTGIVIAGESLGAGIFAGSAAVLAGLWLLGRFGE